MAPVLANIFMRNFEEKALDTYQGPKPSFYRRYVDDSFLIFRDRLHVSPFFEFLNSLHPNIKFTKEEESGESFPFLDIKIQKENNKFSTSTYYKPTHTGVYTNWYSFSPRKYKINLIKTLLFRAWSICSDADRFNHDVGVIKTNLLKNQFPSGLLEAVTRNFIEKVSRHEPQDAPIQTVEKKEVLLILPYLGALSESFEKSLQSIISSAYQQVNLKIVFRTTFRIADLFKIKDPIPKRFKSKLVYGIHCTNCDAVYVGKTKRHLSTRFKEHRDLKHVTAVSSHLMTTGHDASFDDVKIMAYGKIDTELLIKESLIIKQLNPRLNATVKSFPLEMF